MLSINRSLEAKKLWSADARLTRLQHPTEMADLGASTLVLAAVLLSSHPGERPSPKSTRSPTPCSRRDVAAVSTVSSQGPSATRNLSVCRGYGQLWDNNLTLNNLTPIRRDTAPIRRQSSCRTYNRSVLHRGRNPGLRDRSLSAPIIWDDE